FFLVLQPDIGGAAILIGGSMMVIICGGANLKDLFLIIIKLGFILVVILSMLFNVSSESLEKVDHVKDRIVAFLHPWDYPAGAAFQLIQGYYGMGNGGIDGAGFGKSIQKFLYLPYPHTDFIFAIMAEEMGFIGSFIFLMIYLLFLLRALVVSLRCDNVFGRLVGIGIVSLLSVQTFINIGGVTGLIPITGVPLPFISYGGSSLLVYMCSMGIVLSISRTPKDRVINRRKATHRL
ncbi:MAG: FtsW/RodA/SpoVE family cell cycle protein, partial [Bacilli bacterium]